MASPAPPLAWSMTDTGAGTGAHDKDPESSATFLAIGRVARAIAHDFSNLLSAISGSAQLLKRQLDTENPLVDEIKYAADQASILTQQVMRLTEEPLEFPLEGGSSEHARAAGSQAETKTILVVLKQHSVRALVAEFLTAYGYRILQASGAEMAVQAEGSHRGDIHAMLVELERPSRQGPELVRQLAQSRGGMPTIYLAEPGSEIELGAGEYVIRKPLKPGGLVETLRRLLDDSASGTGAQDQSI